MNDIMVPSLISKQQEQDVLLGLVWRLARPATAHPPVSSRPSGNTNPNAVGSIARWLSAQALGFKPRSSTTHNLLGLSEIPIPHP